MYNAKVGEMNAAKICMCWPKSAYHRFAVAAIGFWPVCCKYRADERRSIWSCLIAAVALYALRHFLQINSG